MRFPAFAVGLVLALSKSLDATVAPEYEVPDDIIDPPRATDIWHSLPRRRELDSDTDEFHAYPMPPRHDLYPRRSMDESVEPLAYSEPSAEDLAQLVGIGCEIMGTLRDLVIDGVKTGIRGAGKAAAAYAVQRIFGYQLTQEDQAKLGEIMKNPAWIPTLIDQMHQVCASATSTTQTVPT